MTQFNQAAFQTANDLEENLAEYRVGSTTIGGATLFDLGIEHRGGLVAGEMLADVCLGAAADVFAAAEPGAIGTGVVVKVATDNPVGACLACQYAGWPLSVGDYSAMVSGPIRLLRGKEQLLEKLGLSESGAIGVAVLEADTYPTEAAVLKIAEECSIEPELLTILIAPTTSIAGNIQVVARSVETAMHKLHEVGFDVNDVLSATGSAPLPPPALKSIDGIGRTNDAILYGGSVTLFVDADQAVIDEIGPKVPSNSSSDYGKTFGEIFASYEFDFFKVDPHLFSPAVVTFVNLRSGISRTFGQLRLDILEASFGCKS
ncbi:methenyltetrahydromethanopterin cyclohydrolase [Rosistilla oblonga]|uniref:methenyltetrahydromethanopterin cyclohydrolase n=1 Tax=Rosistilla oblonga TaxID=2527990 RepID=UPI003A97D8E6